jgi:hypothetical protein
MARTTSPSAWVGALTTRRDELLRERGELSSSIAALQERSESIATEVRHIDALLESAARSVATDAASQDPAAAALTDEPATAVDGRSSRRPPWVDEAVGILREVAHPLHYTEINRRLGQRGFTFGGRSPDATLLAGMSRYALFISKGRGHYTVEGVEVPDEWAAHAPSARRARPRSVSRQRSVSRR